MFRIVSIIGFLVTFAGIAVHHTGFPSGSREHQWRAVDVLRKLVYLLMLLFLERRLSLLGRLKKLLYLLALLCFVVLAVTGFYPVLVPGKELSAYLPIVHVAAGGVFAVCLAVLALSWAHQYRFNENDWPWLQSLIRRQTRQKFLPESSDLVHKAAFWLIVLLGLPVFLSIGLSMFALFGIVVQHYLVDTHRYTALLFALAAIVHTYLIVGNEMRKQGLS